MLGISHLLEMMHLQSYLQGGWCFQESPRSVLGVSLHCWGSNPAASPPTNFLFWLPGSHPAMLRGDSWLCTHKSLLVVLGGPYWMPRIKSRLAAWKANALPVGLSLCPPLIFLKVVSTLYALSPLEKNGAQSLATHPTPPPNSHTQTKAQPGWGRHALAMRPRPLVGAKGMELGIEGCWGRIQHLWSWG